CVASVGFSPLSLSQARVTGASYGFFSGLFWANAGAAILDVAPRCDWGFSIGLAIAVQLVAGAPVRYTPRPLAGPLVLVGVLAGLYMLNLLRKGEFDERSRKPA